MPLRPMTQDATLDALPLQGDEPMYDEDVEEIVRDQIFPRRRDVRSMAEEMLHALLANYDSVAEEFDRDFLTDVRDLMRDGVPFTDAVGAFAPEAATDGEMEAAWETYRADLAEQAEACREALDRAIRSSSTE
jgi:hypothetical protein